MDVSDEHQALPAPLLGVLQRAIQESRPDEDVDQVIQEYLAEVNAHLLAGINMCKSHGIMPSAHNLTIAYIHLLQMSANFAINHPDRLAEGRAEIKGICLELLEEALTKGMSAGRTEREKRETADADS